MPNIANSLASHFHPGPIPCSIYLKGPPRNLPPLSSRNLTASSPSEYFVAIPRHAATIIQNSAPGPPAITAVATPTIFPVPIVAAIAVQSAPKLVTSPFAPSSFFTMYFSALPSFLNCSKPSLMVRYIPVPMISTMRGTPQTTPSIASRIFVNASIFFLLLLNKKYLLRSFSAVQ